MSTSPSRHRMLRVEAAGQVRGSAPAVYRLIADYEQGHGRIVPPRYFRNLRVEQGGYGTGTVIRYEMLALGTTQQGHARITEPEPGRVLVETDLVNGAATTFTVEPLGSSVSRVTIATTFATRAGVIGWIQQVVMRSFLRRAFAAELARIDEVVQRDCAAVASTA